MQGIRKPARTLVSVKQFDLFDHSRARRVPGEIYFTRHNKKSRRFPAIFFSPGTSVPLTAYRRTAIYWARHGFATILISHTGKSERADDLSTVSLRPQDVSFVLDELERSKKFPRLDKSRVAAAGHSHGAHTVFLLAGACIKKARSDRPRQFRDPRISAFLALSPPGVSCLGLHAKSFATISSPMLCISGTKDADRTFKKPPSWRKQAFRFSPKGNKFHLLLKDADHYSFFDACTISETTFALPDILTLDSIERAGLAFFKTYLCGSRKKRGSMQASTIRFSLPKDARKGATIDAK